MTYGARFGIVGAIEQEDLRMEEEFVYAADATGEGQLGPSRAEMRRVFSRLALGLCLGCWPAR